MIIQTAGLFILNRKREVLLGHPTNHPTSFWSIPKGAIEVDENPFIAAIRETKEESNIDLPTTIKYIALLPVTFKNKRKRLFPFLVLAEMNPNIDFDSFDLKCNSMVEPEKGGFPEMDTFKWCSIEEAQTIVHESQAICLEEIKSIIISR